MVGWLRRRLLPWLHRGFWPEDHAVLRALASGSTLKSLRYLDGRKVYQRHGLDGSMADVPASSVDRLVRRGLIHTNHKFPAGTYLLTERGRRLAGAHEGHAEPPASPRNYFGG